MLGIRSGRVASARKLVRRTARRRSGLILVEGPQAVTEAVDATVDAVTAGRPPVVLELYCTAEAAARYPDVLEAARAAGVPLVPDPPLARSLHATVEVGQQIPEELYAAVAQLLAFVYRVARRSAA